VTTTVTETGLAPDEEAAEAQAIAARAERAATKKLAEAEGVARRELEQRNVAELLRAEPEVQQEVRAAVNRTTKKALEQRARVLGEIDSVEERGSVDGNYELTITVKT